MGKIEKREITGELQESYLDYAMSVIVARALPDVRDGLKPVHRRILWDMWDSGLGHLAKFRKSANVIGQVLARYHPHGDVAVYDALVRMAQDFSLRYPLVQGQGNFGSIDGDAPAAYRYTESRLSKIAEETLSDIEKETVDWQPNYDATRLEPKVLPAKLPNLLINGSMGIAVGMATNIPSHNVGEVADAVLFLAEHPDASAEELAQFLKGPDFATGGLIFDRRAIQEAYLTGRGTIVTRAKVEVMERKSKQFDLVISEVPYQVNKAELVKKIAELVQDKKVEGIRDLRDESDRNGLRVVVELKTDASPQKVLNQLYRHTDLQKDFHVNMIALVDGIEPRLLSVKEMLAAYFEHRKSVVRRRTQFDLARAKERAHILEGLVKALEQINQVIATIKKSKDREDAHRNLVSRFALTDIQATAILEMRLQTLAALEREKIEDELKEKRALAKGLEAILKSPAKIVQIIKDEVSELKAKYGGPRRTEVVAGPLGEFREEDLVPEEEVVITLSASGYVKRLPPQTFTSQRRGGKGLIGSEVSEADFLTHFVRARTHDHILFFTNRGRVFGARVYEIPQASRTSKGRAIHNFLELPADEEVRAVLSYREAGESGKYLILGTASGLIKKTPLQDFANIRRTGIIAVSLKKGDALRWVRLSGGNDEVILATVHGQAIRFSERQIRAMSRTAAGIRAIRLKPGDAVAGFDIIKGGATDIANHKLLVVMANGFGKQTPLTEYKRQNRGGSGIKTANLTEKTGKLVTALIVSTETEILALSEKGQVLRTELRSVRQTSRAAQGVRLMRLKSGDRLAGVVVI